MYKTYFNWSSGKDCALALHYLLQEKNYKVESLLTCINKELQRVSMHGLSVDLLQKQSNAIGIPLEFIELPMQTSNAVYEDLCGQKVKDLIQRGFNATAFGDIFLEDLKKYRENQLKTSDIHIRFPLWKKNSLKLIHEFINLGFKAVVVCVNGELLPSSFVGRTIDHDFIHDLPKNVDPCGENGEFHTFCYNGPIFKHPVKFDLKEIVEKSYHHNGTTTKYYFADLLDGDV